MELPTDRLAASLEGSAWRELVHLAEVGSTNDEVLRRWQAGAAPGLVVVADHQTGGRGRLGRPWRDRGAGAEAHRSLAVSVLVPVPAAGATLVPLATGLAVADAAGRRGVPARLKWPNDVLVDGRKVAGILVERHAARGGAALVVGVGVNVDWRGVERDRESAAWGSLAEAAGRDVDRWELLVDLLRALDRRLGELGADPAALLAAYGGRCDTIGRPVRVVHGGGELRGEAVGIDRDGALLLDAGGAEPVRVTAGDVVHLRPL